MIDHKHKCKVHNVYKVNEKKVKKAIKSKQTNHTEC